MYGFDEDTGIATLYIITNAPERFVDSTGALFYTADGTATGSGGIVGHVIKLLGLLMQKTSRFADYG